MTNEIKESIKRIQNIVDFYKLNDENNYDYSDDVLISMKILLDYITNLQEEIDKLTAESTEWESKVYELQEENERLRKELELCKKNGEM